MTRQRYLSSARPIMITAPADDPYQEMTKRIYRHMHMISLQRLPASSFLTVFSPSIIVRLISDESGGSRGQMAPRSHLFIPITVNRNPVNLTRQIFKRAREKGLFASCIELPCGKRLWSFHPNADDMIYCGHFKITRPRDSIINHIPEHKALWFLDAYDRDLYDDMLSL